MTKEKIDYTEQDIYEYFGADQEIHKATRHDLLGVIGGMSGILELLWHKEITPEIALNDFKAWLKEKESADLPCQEVLDINQKLPDTDNPIKKEEEAHA